MKLWHLMIIQSADEYGEYDDWIEIYNKGSNSINLNNYYLSDDISNLTKYIFPDYILGPNEYFIVWADDDEEEQETLIMQHLNYLQLESLCIYQI